VDDSRPGRGLIANSFPVRAPEANVHRLLARVREPLLEILRMSPDFEAAYYPLLGMAARQYPVDPRQAKALLLELERINPSRGDAKRLRERLVARQVG
jgi:spermidine synthase